MTGSVVRTSPCPSVISHLQFSHSCIVSGSLDGCIRTHDPRTALIRELNTETVSKAHASGFAGIECSGNFLFTIGWGLRYSVSLFPPTPHRLNLTNRQSRPIPDQLVKVYDMRTMRPLPPVAFSAGPAFINVLPKRSSTIVIASSQGLINVVDVSNASTASEFHQVRSSMV
jgi:hypothetical protein